MRNQPQQKPPPRPLTEHAPHCDRWMEYQQVIVAGLPRIGRCVTCGAVEKTSAGDPR